jgi:hypothetical protein
MTSSAATAVTMAIHIAMGTWVVLSTPDDIVAVRVCAVPAWWVAVAGAAPGCSPAGAEA